MSSKRSSDTEVIALRDIDYHIDLVRYFIGEMTYAQFSVDLRTVYASVRCLEIISEASRRLHEDMKDRHPGIAWRNMAGAGNVYRHDYEDVEAQFVWQTIHVSLPPLKAVVGAELANL